MSAIKTGFIQFFNPITGKPVSNGYVSTYENDGGISPKPTFSDLAENNQNDNPVRLDASGSAPFFGSGAYTFVVRDAAGTVVSTINDLGMDQAGNNVPSSDTPVGSIGTADDQFDGEDFTVVYDNTGAVLCKATIRAAWTAGADSAGSVIGEYNTAMDTFAEGGGTPQEGSIVFGGPQEGYDDASTRLYQLVGNPNINPESDVNVTDSGKGDNWNDLLKLAATEEIRKKSLVGLWSNVKNIISSGVISYPLMVFGSDGILYRTTGSPSAESIIDTDPVTDTAHDVWVFVYDPTATAAYPPAYRSLNGGIDYNSSTSIKCPIQYHKLVNSSGEFVNDGTPTEIFYKSTNATWEYGAGTTGSPAGGSAIGSLPDGWHSTWLIKTESGVYDYVHTNLNLSSTLILVNGIDTGSGRVWAYGRRVAKFKVLAGVVVNFKRNGNEYTMVTTTSSSPITANADTSVVVFCPPSSADIRFDARFSIYCTSAYRTNGQSYPFVKILGYEQTAGGYDFSTISDSEHDVNFTSAGGAEFVRTVNASSEIVFSMTGNALHTFYVKSTGFIDSLTD